MPKDIQSIVKQSGESDLPGLAERVLFTPSPRQRQVKARFWVRFIPGPVATLDNLSLSHVMQIAGTKSLKEWWSEPGFVEWFFNREEGREKLEYLFMRALDTAEDILNDPGAQASAKVNMIKVIGELANKFPSKHQERFSDEDINKMDEKQLKNYLEKRGVTVKEENIIDVTASNEKETEGSN